MKKFLAILVVAFLATSFAFSQHNAAVPVTAQFDIAVIKPLEWKVTNGALNLGDVIKTQIKVMTNYPSLPNVVTFTLEGEAVYGTSIPHYVDITKAGPEANVNGVVLNGTWVGDGVNLPLGTDGKRTVTYTVDDVDASQATQTGPVQFNISVSAKYTNL